MNTSSVLWVIEEHDRFVTRPGEWDAVGNGESYLFHRDGEEAVEALNERDPGRYRLACYVRMEPT